VADFNGDGHIDIATGNPTSNGDALYLYLGQGDGSFTGPYSAGLAYITSMQVADFNGDGLPDLITSGHAGTNNAGYLLIGIGDGTFQAPTAGGGTERLALADFNGDGVIDFVSYMGLNGSARYVQLGPLIQGGSGNTLGGDINGDSCLIAA